MRKAITLLVAAAATLAFAGSAFASFAPKLVVSTEGNAARLGVVVNNADDPTAKVTIYVPNGYTVANAAPGKLGSVTATAAAADLGGAVLPLTGELDAIAPTATTQAQAQQCGVAPAQTWNLHLTAAGQTLDIPMFVVAPAAPEAASGFNTKLVVCLPPPDVPAGTPGRATFGAKLLSATFTSSAITGPQPAGDYRWTSLWTPYSPGRGVPNPAGSVEAQSIRHLPIVVSFNSTKKRIVTFTTKRVKGKKVKVKHVATRIAWKLSATTNGKAPSDSLIAVFYKNKRIGGASGSLTVRGVPSVKLTVVAALDSDTASVPTGQTATVDDLFYHDLGATACTPTALFQGLPCIDATVGGEFVGGTVTIKAYTK
jgi:hypothetical protein